MDRYPSIVISSEGWEEELTSGVENMLASDGTWKTHILYPKTSYIGTFYHPLISREQYNQIVRFWRVNRGKEFIFESPTLEIDIVSRFGERPLITERVVDMLTVKVQMLGAIDE